MAGEVLRKAEVDHFDAAGVVLASEHKVLGLDVAMADVLSVQVDQCGEKLVHDQCCLTFAQVLALDDEVEQLATFTVPELAQKSMVKSLFANEAESERIRKSKKNHRRKSRVCEESFPRVRQMQSDTWTILTPAPRSRRRSTPRSRAA